MKEKNIYIRALSLAIPMMIQSAIMNAVSLVDNIMVGSLGTESMTAVSIVGQLCFVFSLAIFGGLSGPGIYGAQYYGRNDIDGVQKIFRLKWWISMACLIVGVLIFLCFGKPLVLLYLQGQSENIDAAFTLTHAIEYMDIMLIGLVPFSITQIYATSLRETGDTIKTMVAGIGSVVTDICLNYILIYGKFGAPRLEVKGAAIATVIARFVELGILVIWSHAMVKKNVFLKHIYRTLKVPVDLAGTVIKNGFPIFLNELLWSAGIAVLTQCYSTRGLDIIAGLNISNAICNLLNVVFITMGNAVGIIIGQLLGASRYEEAKKDSVRLMWFIGALSAVPMLILIALSHSFPLLYQTTDRVRNLGTYFIIITALFFPLQGILNALYFTLRAGGKTIITFLFDCGYSWVVSVPVALILCRFSTIPILVIYTIVQALDFIKVTVGFVMIKKGVWVRNLIE